MVLSILLPELHFLYIREMPDRNAETIEQLKRQFWETMARADALRNVAASLRNEEQAARLIQKAQAEEDKARKFLKEAEALAKEPLQ